MQGSKRNGCLHLDLFKQIISMSPAELTVSRLNRTAAKIISELKSIKNIYLKQCGWKERTFAMKDIQA